MEPSNSGVRGRAHRCGAQSGGRDRKTEEKGRDGDLRRWGTKKPAERGTNEQGPEGQEKAWMGAQMGYLEAGEGRNTGKRGKARGSTDGRPRGRWREGQKDRNTGVGSRDPGVLTSRGERKNQEGALPRPISSGSREKKELRSRREGHRGGLIRALAAAAPSAPLGEPPIPTLATSKAPLLISSQRKGWRGGQHSQDWEKDREDGDRDKQREMGRGRGDKETEGEKDGETGGRDGVMEGVETGRERCEDRDRVIWEREAQRE